jgi:autotransporter strand-loop-strand O-heptosyltransferase
MSDTVPNKADTKLEAPAAPTASDHTTDTTSATPAPKPPYPAAASEQTQAGPLGIRFDFNFGARLFIPAGSDGGWISTISDLETGNILFQANQRGVSIQSTKRYFVRFGIEIRDEKGGIVFSHRYDATNQRVLVVLPIGTLGDSLGWLPYAIRFAKVHQCKLTVALAERLIELFKDAYPEIEFVTHEQIKPETFYATYNIGLFFEDGEHVFQPTDFRHVGLHRTAGYILGVDPAEEPARIALKDEAPPIPDPYVVIAVQASTYAKKWNNPGGWHEIIRRLKEAGYRVICIDRERVHGAGVAWTHIPHGVEDETGDRPLLERARWLKHASAFIGVSSGLAWLAWSVSCPVVLVSGFTHPTNEFATPGRVINWHACNSCWNDVRHVFDHSDYLWCPRHQGTDRAFECSRLITAEQVWAATQRVLAENADPPALEAFSVDWGRIGLPERP